MRFVADAGLWVVGPAVAVVPAVAVLEVSGAVLEWTVDDRDGVAATRMTITDRAAAEWLWRVVGPAGHAAIASGVEPVDVDLVPEALEPLRRIAIGHWLRRWWPESRRDGIVPLDRALLDGELAILVSAAQEFLSEDTLDADVEGLLAPHQSALRAFELGADPRVAEMAAACAELADDLGAWSAEPSELLAGPVSGRREDFALVAGPEGERSRSAIARGVGSVDWVTVPHGLFDAADRTIDWSVEGADSSVFAMLRVALTGQAPARGIEVRLRSGSVSATGVLDTRGTAALSMLFEDGRELTENQAWGHDWSTTSVAIGPHRSDPGDSAEAAELRQRIRAFARARLAEPGPDAFFAELVATEADY
ncbi:hypothetical protein [Mycolicibacterium hodleri]|uniref:Uncharacterized protein n=1 Tax=Mycolicibacterium hodleri TaxID=49897 RepID=A0A502E3R5_9MYCO|nr:hypothetical protein [Mycolicibacterium hodleri]TPG32167.1 hypothetical protein EAH80_20270 [Mycolicibacterium hodleri]